MYWWKWRVFRERSKTCKSYPSCRTGSKTKIFATYENSTENVFHPTGWNTRAHRHPHSWDVHIRVNLKENTPKFILIGIHCLVSLGYFEKILVMIPSKMMPVECRSTHNHSGRLLARASSALSLCTPLLGSHSNSHNSMYTVKPSNLGMPSEKLGDSLGTLLDTVYPYVF